MRYGYRHKHLLLVIEGRRYWLWASGFAAGFFLLSALTGHGWIAPDGFTTLLILPTSTGNEFLSTRSTKSWPTLSSVRSCWPEP